MVVLFSERVFILFRDQWSVWCSIAPEQCKQTIKIQSVLWYTICSIRDNSGAVVRSQKENHINTLVRPLTWQQHTSLVYQVALLKWNKCYLWLMFSGSPWFVGAWFAYSTLHKCGINLQYIKFTFGSQHARSSTFDFHFSTAGCQKRCGESSWSQLRARHVDGFFLFSVMNTYKPFEVKGIRLELTLK